MQILLAGLLAMLMTSSWESTSLDEFQVIGIEARTSNAQEMTKDGVIPKQWERLMKENLLARIPHKTDRAIVALYTDYQSDKDGAYTYVLGAKVSSVATVPEGMVARKVPAGRYAVFTSDRGAAARVVFETWKRIWDAPLDRVYRTDFEVYDQPAAGSQKPPVGIYVGIRQ